MDRARQMPEAWWRLLVWGWRFIAITPAHLSGIGLQTMNPFANHRLIQFRIAEINLPSRNYRTGIPHGDSRQRRRFSAGKVRLDPRIHTSLRSEWRDATRKKVSF